MNKIFVAISLLIFLGCQSNHTSKNEPFVQLTHFIDQYSQSTIAHGNVNAISVAIYKDGYTYHNYYGEIDPGAENLPNDTTLFEIASITKIFTGSLMARAVIDKKVSLDIDIREFLPGDYPNLEYDSKPVTIHSLVTHTLGFKTPQKLDSVYTEIFAGNYGKKPIDYGMDDLFVELQTVELNHTPGTFYDYNNVGPDLAAYILEQVYKKSYPDILKELLDEIGMENTYLQEYDKYKDRLINGYTESGELATKDENPLLGGASGIITTLPDLMKFMKYQLESDNPFIKESTRSLYQNEEEELGYMWDLGYAEEEGFYYLKSGTSNGVQSILLLCPDSDYGQILLMNNTSDKATNDWISLYNKIEYDLIKYPKINLWSKLEPLFNVNPEEASNQYQALKKDTILFFSESNYLNRIGYDFLYHNQIKSAIEVFELAIRTDPENANLYDSLGEAYYKAKEYEKSKINFEKSLNLNPNNSNAEAYIIAINKII
jgi:CubicO group peptidase (beta-lactamase class C family)